MLKQRLITAAILIPIVVWALLALSSGAIVIVFTLVAALAAWEWLSLMGSNSRVVKCACLTALTGMGALLWYLMPSTWVMLLAAIVWGAASLLVIVFAHRPLALRLSAIFKTTWFGLISMLVILSCFVISAGWLHAFSEQGPALLLYVMVTVWLADTGGYFAGKRFGKTKLAVAISPNKTWEGVAGAQFLALLWAVLFYFTPVETGLSLPVWLTLTAFIVMVSIVGDLLESVFKRCFDKKDSGQLLPGHGGMLDRVDSMLAAVPIFTACLLMLGAS